MKQGLYALSVVFIAALYVGCGGSSEKSDSTPSKSSAPQESAGSRKSESRTESRRGGKYEKLTSAVTAGSDSRVEKAASELLAENTRDVKALNLLGVHHYRKGRIQLAEIVFLRALKVDSDNAEVLANMGYVYKSQGDLSRAISHFRKALDANSRSVSAAAGLGAIYLEYGDYARARIALETAYERRKKDFAIVSNYAAALAASGDKGEAKDLFEKAMDLKNNDSNVLVNYAILLVDGMKEYKRGQEIIDRLKFKGVPPKHRTLVRNLESQIQRGSK